MVFSASPRIIDKPRAKAAKATARATKGRPRPVDVYVGSRVRLRRTLLGFSQEKLGDELGLTFQQVQKYERGTNRIGASRLYELSRILDVPVSYFFDEMPEEGKAGAGHRRAGLAEDAGGYEHDPLSRRETLELVRAYYNIENAKIRRKIFELIKSLAATA